MNENEIELIFQKISLFLMIIGLIVIFITLVNYFLNVGSSFLWPDRHHFVFIGCIFIMVGCLLRINFVVNWIIAHPNPTLLFSSLIIGLLIIEFGLAAFEAVTPFPTNYIIKDDKLGYKLLPNTPDNDINGWRNEKFRKNYTIVAIGDSQTYGINVKRSDAWPQLLEKVSGYSVYNMGLGGYGPVQYSVLADNAINLSPKLVIIGLYFGNDIHDSYYTIYVNKDTRDQYISLRNDSLYSGFKQDIVSDNLENLTEKDNGIFKKYENNKLWILKVQDFLMARSSLITFLARNGLLSYQQDNGRYLGSPEDYTIFEKNRINTVLTPAYRLLVENTDEPRITEGLRITKERIVHIKKNTSENNIEMILLLIPTKERVYADSLKINNISVSKKYQTLIDFEDKNKNDIISICEDNNITYIDTYFVLSQAAKDNIPIYPNSDDGHPNANGYKLIAGTINSELSKFNLSEKNGSGF